VGRWCDESVGKKKREIKFLSPTSSNAIIKKIAGDSVSVTETQYYFYQAQDLVIETISKVSGTMSESFGTFAKWVVSPSNVKETTCKITVRNEYKGSWFKATIEDFIQAASVTAFEKYKQMVMDYVEKHKQKEAILSPKPLALVKTPQAMLRDSETDTEDEFFDTESNFFPQSLKFLEDVAQDIGQLRHSLQSTEARLMALETAFLNVQVKYIPPDKHQAINFYENLVEYFKHLDDLSTKLDQHKRLQENDKLLLKKIDRLTVRTTSDSITWTVVITLLLIAWPVAIHQAWNFLKSYWTRKH